MTDKHTNRNNSFGNLPDDIRVNPFTVPDRYFEDLAKHTMLRAKLRQDMDEGLGVPNGYFDTLSQDIVSRIRTEGLKERAPESGMATPEGYFDGLSAKLMAKIQNEEKNLDDHAVQTPVRRMWTRQWLPYVAASFLILAIGVATYIGMNPNTEPNIATVSNLQAVPEQEIISYLELYAESDYMLYQVAQDGDLEEWIGEEFDEADIEAYFNNMML